MTYTIKCRPVGETEPGAFAMLRRYDEEAYAEQTDTDDQGNEVWTVHSSGDISRFLDNQPTVIEYMEAR